MNKILEFGREAMFYVRFLSGYEARRIRSYRLQLRKHIQRAEVLKAAERKIPEQIISTEVRRMVEDIEAMDRKIEETETAINKYFKPLDREAEIIMKTQLDGEEKSMREMRKTMQTQALLEKAEADRIAMSKDAEADGIETEKIAEASHCIQEKPSESTKAS